MLVRKLYMHFFHAAVCQFYRSREACSSPAGLWSAEQDTDLYRSCMLALKVASAQGAEDSPDRRVGIIILSPQHGPGGHRLVHARTWRHRLVQAVSRGGHAGHGFLPFLTVQVQNFKTRRMLTTMQRWGPMHAIIAFTLSQGLSARQCRSLPLHLGDAFVTCLND